MANVKDPKIRQYYKPSDREEKELHHVYDRFRDMKEAQSRTDAEKEWDNGEKAWDQYEKAIEKLDDWQAKYYVPITTAVVESILSEMIDQAPQPIVLPRSEEDKPKAVVMKHAFDYTWEIGNGNEELEHVLKDCLIYGDGFAQEYYWKDTRTIKILKNIGKDKKGKKFEDYEEVEKYDYDDCYMESVSPFELYFDERARSINRGPYRARDAIRRYVMKLEDARQFFKGDIWDPMGNMRFVRSGGDTNWYSFFKPPEDMNHKDEVEVLWYWGRQPEDWLKIVINDVLIKAGPNPYRHKQLPFAKTEDVKRPHKFYNKGEPKLLDSIQKETNTMRRMLTDRNHLDIDKMWLVSRNESYSEEETMTRPHGVIRVDDPANYKSVEYQDVSQSFFLNMAELNKDAVRVTGAEERFQSVKTPGTATAAAIEKESVQRRIKAKLHRMENGFLVDIGRMRASNIIQFYSQPKLEKIVGEAGTKEYQTLVATAQRKGLLVNIDGKPHIEKYKTIRIEGKQLVGDEKGEIREKPQPGFSFFEMRPKDFVPSAEDGFDIRFLAGSTMPVSKALMAKQTQDAVAQLMPLATAGVGYDPVKLGDDLLRSLDKDPNEYHAEKPAEDLSMAQRDMSVNLAIKENEEFTNGGAIPPLGTPFATPDHSMIHVSFLYSPQAREWPDEKYQMLVKHIMGEIESQKQRAGAATMMGQGQGNLPNQSGTTPESPQGGAPAPAAPYNQELKAINPAQVQGGEEVEGGTKGSIMNRVFSLMGRKR